MNIVQRKVLQNVFKFRGIRLMSGIGRPVEPKVLSIADIPGIIYRENKPVSIEDDTPFDEYDSNRLPETYSALRDRFGDLVKEVFSDDRTVLHVFNPKDIQTVYQNDGKYPRRLSHRAFERYRLDRPRLYSGPGLLPTSGEEWLRFRKLFNAVMRNRTLIEKMGFYMEEVANDFIEVVDRALDDAFEINISPWVFRWGLETMGYICFQRRFGCLTPEGNADATDLINATEAINYATYLYENEQTEENYAPLEKSMQIIDRVIGNYYEDFLCEDWLSKECLVTELLLHSKAKKEEVFTLLIDMFLAGIDSMAFTSIFMLYNLAENKEAQHALRNEIMAYTPNRDDSVAGYRGLTPYLLAFYTESLRLYPVSIGNGRLLNNDVILSGYKVPKDTMVILQHQVCSRSETAFENATSFKPERWLGKDKPNKIPVSSFGHGVRACIGEFIARKESKIFLQKVVRNFQIDHFYEPLGSRSVLLNAPDQDLYLYMMRLPK